MNQHNPAALAEGGVFHGRYQIVRCLKAGGMGAVYECIHLTTQKHRALKVMLPQILATAGMRERFELEARVTALIESEHIVETFDAGVDEPTGAPFLVMELLRGDDLDSIVQSRGPFAAEEAVVLLSQAALALDKTHAAGIVHRDLKPQNLFLTTRDDGSPRLKILDFGIAKVVADGTKTAQQTAAIGTPVYMAPEQTTGDGAIGPAADLYALGHITYALLSGEAYWMEEQQALAVYGFLSRMLAGPIEPPTLRAGRRGVALPAAFDAWFARATARSPSDRFDRASTQIAELATALGTPAPRLLLATPPPLTQSSSPGFLAAPHEPVRAASQPAAVPSSDVGSRAPSGPPRASVGPVGPSGTMAALANDPIPPRPVSSRTPVFVLAIGVGIVVAAAALFGVVRALQAPNGGQAAAAALSAAAQTSPALAPTEAVAVTPAPTVEPAAPASASPSPSSAASTASTERPKKPSPPPTPPVPPTKPTAAPKAPPNCNPPFTLDAKGIKHAKPECF